MTQAEFHKRYQYNPNNDCLGEGGFGKVYKAYDTHLNHYVAIKMAEVKPHLEEVRLRKEVDLVNKLPTHPNIAHYDECYTFSTFAGEYDFGVLQYYEQGNLQQLITDKQLTYYQKDSMLKQILDGIVFLHSQGIIHRDLKPQNILIALNRNGVFIPKITDFGISKKLDINKSSAYTNSLAGAGTLSFASPEQLCGLTIRKNTDLWSFGVMVCWMFTGKLPFNSGSLAVTSEAGRIELFKQITSGEVTSIIAQLPADWRNLVKECIIIDVDKRIGSAGKCLEMLDGNIFENKKRTILTDEIKFSKQLNPKTNLEKKKPVSDLYKPKFEEYKSNKSYIWIILGVILIVLIIWMSGDFINPNVTKLVGTSNAVDSIATVNDSSIIRNSPIKKSESISNEIIDFIPADFFMKITPASSLQSIKNLFGEPKKLLSKSKTGLNYDLYFFNLRNCFMLLSTVDNLSISTICIQSKGIEPFVKIGSYCPISINNNTILLGKSCFNKIKRVDESNNEIEVGRDRCSEYIIITEYVGKPCDYYSFAFGSFVTLGSINLDRLTEENKFFENSIGTGVINIPSTSKIDYVIIGDKDAMKNIHSYGEGVHCDYY